jgi:hypothetical protein
LRFKQLGEIAMRLFAGTLLVLVATVAASPWLLADDKVKPPEYLPLKEGLKWHYQVEANGQKLQLVTQVAKIEAINGQSLARLETVSGGTVAASEHLSVTAKGIFRHRYNGVEISPPVCLLKFPVKNGASWESENKVGEQSAKMVCRVSSEEVEVPAGKFKTVSVQVVADAAGMKITTTYWFAAGVGIVKQTAEIAGQQIEMKLEKFERGK